MRRVRSYFLALVGSLPAIQLILPAQQVLAGVNNGPDAIISFAAPATLTHDEMVQAWKSADLTESMVSKINALLAGPFISNEAHYRGNCVNLGKDPRLGSFLRVGFWNLQRGRHIDEIKLAFQSPEDFKRRIKVAPQTKKYTEILEQLEVLRSVDVLALNEVDLGLKRTGYKDVARELATALNMNYTFGVEFLEIDPINLGTEEFKEVSSAAKRGKLRELVEVDKERYVGLHGTAILSRFPIRRVKLIPLEYQPYDWNKAERGRVSLPEVMRRQLSHMAFQEKVTRQVRYGGRSVLIAELDIPQLPGGSLTVVATHLENYSGPKGRRRQMKEVLSLIKDIKGPVVFAGDLNTSGSNLRPTTILGEVKARVVNKKFWTKALIKSVVSVGPVLDVSLEAVGFARTVHDPTGRGLFLLGPNKEAGMFSDLKRMRFADGFAFDFRGDRNRTINGTGGTLANSNQRAITKGFITTHAMKRTYWAVGKSKLDWIFVKAYAREPNDRTAPYRMAPHFPRTLEKLNSSLGYRLSDHNPITVDLPVDEPELINLGEQHLSNGNLKASQAADIETALPLP